MKIYLFATFLFIYLSHEVVAQPVVGLTLQSGVSKIETAFQRGHDDPQHLLRPSFKGSLYIGQRNSSFLYYAFEVMFLNIQGNYQRLEDSENYRGVNPPVPDTIEEKYNLYYSSISPQFGFTIAKLKIIAGFCPSILVHSKIKSIKNESTQFSRSNDLKPEIIKIGYKAGLFYPVNEDLGINFDMIWLDRGFNEKWRVTHYSVGIRYIFGKEKV